MDSGDAPSRACSAESMDSTRSSGTTSLQELHLQDVVDEAASDDMCGYKTPVTSPRRLQAGQWKALDLSGPEVQVEHEHRKP